MKKICIWAIGSIFLFFAVAIAWKTYTTTVLDWNGILVSYNKSTPFIIEQFNTDKLQLSFRDFSPAGSIMCIQTDYRTMEHLKRSLHAKKFLKDVHVQFDGDSTSIARAEYTFKETGNYSLSFFFLDKGLVCGFIGPKENYPLFAPTLLDAVHGN